MSTKRDDQPRTVELNDKELDAVTGGDKSAGGKKGSSSGNNNSHEFLVVRLDNTLISS